MSHPPNMDSAQSRGRRLAGYVLALLASLAVLLALDGAARLSAERWTLAELRAQAQAVAGPRVAVLRSEIEKQRTLPVVLAQDPDVRAALEARDPERLGALNAKLETLAGSTRAGVIYLLDARGMTIAASNYRSPASFVGSDYSFRPYFALAMEDGSAEHFALGTVSRQPGLYLTRRIDGPGEPLGVVVVKAEFETVEADWRRFDEPTFVTDDRQIVLVTSVPAWRFRATTDIPPEQRARIRSSLQFGDAALDALPFRRTGEDRISTILPGAAKPREFVEASVPVPTTAWTLHVLVPLPGAASPVTLAARALALLSGGIGIGLMALWLARRRRLAQERRLQAVMRHELEERVEARTAELREEIEERRRAQSALHGMQDELVQASKLAVLGQIAASVAHEVNQPVAAIRTFAETGAVLLAQGPRYVASEVARGNFSTIVSLTERIGAITGELRAFARKTPGHVGRVALATAIDGALLLVGHRLRQQGIDVVLDIAEADLAVAAERVRLEQVFVNLLQNAAEALADRAGGQIRIIAMAEGSRVRVSVADNGPGLPPPVLEALFMPFTTTKPEGLGLGLVISHDIVAEFGGSFTVENRDGAVFTITLPRLS